MNEMGREEHTARPRREIILELLAVGWIACWVYAAYQGPQPLLPFISEEYAVPRADAGLIMTCIMLPLGLAPIFYGLFLNSLPLTRTLAVVLPLYALSLLPAVLGCSFSALLFFRLVQGFFLPAVLVTLMTYLSTRFEGGLLQRGMSFYALSTVMGGFGGRLLSGFVASRLGWNAAFAVLLLGVLLTLPALSFLTLRGRAQVRPLPLRAVGEVFRQKNMAPLLFIAPFCVLANTSVLNVLPFRLQQLEPSITAFGIGFIYVGVMLSMISGVCSGRIIKWFGGELKGVAAGIGLYVLLVPLLAVPSVPGLFLVLFVGNLGYCFVYTSMPGIVNRFSRADRALTNGVYMTIYYLHAAIGSYVPVIVYDSFGLYPYLGLVFGLAVISLCLAWALRRTVLDRAEP